MRHSHGRGGDPTGSLGGDMREWLDDLRNRLGYSAHQVRRCERTAEAFVKFSGAKTVEELRPLAVMRWLNARSELVTRKTLLNDTGALRCFADWLVSAERIEVNPLRSLRTPRIKKTRGPEPLTLDEMRRLIAVARDAEENGTHQQTRFGPIRSTFYAFLARTGLRWAEARAQLWKDIDLRTGVMLVSRSKGGWTHTLPLDRECVELLGRWQRWSEGDRVFERCPSHHTLRRDMRRAGIPDAPGEFHRIRKLAITERAARGATLRDLHAFARHINPQTTQLHYDFVRLSEMRVAAELLPAVRTFRAS